MLTWNRIKMNKNSVRRGLFSVLLAVGWSAPSSSIVPRRPARPWRSHPPSSRRLAVVARPDLDWSSASGSGLVHGSRGDSVPRSGNRSLSTTASSRSGRPWTASSNSKRKSRGINVREDGAWTRPWTRRADLEITRRRKTEENGRGSTQTQQWSN